MFLCDPLTLLFSFAQYKDKSVGLRLQPTVDDAEYECEKAEWTGENERRTSTCEYFWLTSSLCCVRFTATWTTYLLHIATALQRLIGALTTALGAALSGKHVRIPLFAPHSNL